MSEGTGPLNFAMRYHFPGNMNAANQHGRVPGAIRPVRSRIRLAHSSLSTHGSEVSNRAPLLGTRMQAESGASHRKQRLGAHSTRYTKRASLVSRCPVPGSGCSDSGCFVLQCGFPASPGEINRNIPLIESLVSHSKQRSAPQINRNISRRSPARTILSTLYFSFSTAANINPQLSCTESATVRRSNGSGPTARPHWSDSGVESRVKSGGEEFRPGGRIHHV